MEPAEKITVCIVALRRHDPGDLPVAPINIAKSFFRDPGIAGIQHVDVSHGSVSFIKIVTTVTASMLFCYFGGALVWVYYIAILIKKVTNCLLRDIAHIKNVTDLRLWNISHSRRRPNVWPMRHDRPYCHGRKNHGSQTQSG